MKIDVRDFWCAENHDDRSNDVTSELDSCDELNTLLGLI